MLTSLEVDYSDSDPISWFAVLTVVAASVLVIWLVARWNRFAAKVIAIVLAVSVLGSLAFSAIAAVVFT